MAAESSVGVTIAISAVLGGMVAIDNAQTVMLSARN
jgi:hypothetical protein